MPTLHAIVMAAGKGTRLKSALPKVLHPLFGKSLLSRVLQTLAGLSVTETAVIVGHGREQVQAELADLPGQLKTVVQEPQLGTGHAVQQVKAALPQWETEAGDVLILSGDVPLLTAESLKALLETHRASKNQLTVLATRMPNPFGYGRVITEGDRVLRIVEQKDATPEEQAVDRVNTGVYCLHWPAIAPFLDRLSSDNAQGEFYLTDVIALAVEAGLNVGMSDLADADEVTGVNSRSDLALCHELLNRRTLNRLMAEGVTLLQPATTMIGPEVSIGADTVVLPGCTLMGDITIGKNCSIGPHTTMTETVRIGDDCRIMHSVLRDTIIGDHGHVGPFAQLRDGVELSHHVHIGNFVELKKTTVDHHSNAGHLAYLGDARIGSDVNVGAGAITANFDAIRNTKSETVIEDGAKISSNSVLVAPVTVGKDAFVAAGSVITRDVAEGDLAIARPKQSVLPGWVKKAKAAAEKL